VRLDREVLELLRNEPELLAIADAIVATQVLDAASSALTSREPGRMLSDHEADARDA
jgi:hypothetical protein